MAPCSRSSRSARVQASKLRRAGRIGSGVSDGEHVHDAVVARWRWSAAPSPTTASIAAKACSRRGTSRSKAPALTSVSSVRRLMMRGSTRVGEVREVRERLVAARLDDVLGDRLPDALDGADGVEDLAVARGEHRVRAVDAGRHDLDAVLLGVVAEFVELVGVAHVERHRRGDEFLREVRLEVGRLVGDVGVGRRVRLVEAVFGELGAGIEDGDGERPCRCPCSLGALEEAAALRVHLGLDLLAHGAAQQIGFGQRVAGQVAWRSAAPAPGR